mgnify:CR=1 FL=1
MTTLDDMRSCIQEWFAQAISAEDLREIYYVVRSEADKQHEYMFEMLKGGEAE